MMREGSLRIAGWVRTMIRGDGGGREHSGRFYVVMWWVAVPISGLSSKMRMMNSLEGDLGRSQASAYTTLTQPLVTMMTMKARIVR